MKFFLTEMPMRMKEVVSDEDVATIARDLLIDWEALRPYLGLNRQQEVEIRQSYTGKYGKQKQECLEQWKELKGKKATYGELIKAAEKAKDQQLADRVGDMLLRELESQEIEEIEGISEDELDASLQAEVEDTKNLGRGKVMIPCPIALYLAVPIYYVCIVTSMAPFVP